jgi:electron transport complex protein RnfC
MGLMPTHISSFIRHERFMDAKDYGVLDCIECGCCAYICPAKLPLVHTIKYGKNQVYKLERST